MIETEADFQKFISNNRGDWIVHAIPLNRGIHPSDNTPCLLFIKVLNTGKIYYYSYNHPDSLPVITADKFNEVFRTSSNKKWTLDRKSFCQLIPTENVYDANYNSFQRTNEIFTFNEFETAAHDLIKRNSNGIIDISRYIPLMKHLEAFNNICDVIFKLITPSELTSEIINVVILETLEKMESVGIYVDRSIYSKYYTVIPNSKNLVYSQYNIYTSTGRPSNRFGGVNYAALNSKDGSRAAFVSRYGADGKIVVIDYSAFHPRIICFLTGYDIPLEIDIYEYLAKLYFRKQSIDEIDILEAKKLTFKQLYGEIEDKYSHIKYLGVLKSYIQREWDFFNENEYVETPIFKRKITINHLTDPTPNKVFNYILQAVEGEIAIYRLREVQKFLSTKKTKAILYTYDAVIYDFHRDDGMDTLKRIREIMGFEGKFPTKVYVGDSYQSVKRVDIP